MLLPQVYSCMIPTCTIVISWICPVCDLSKQCTIKQTAEFWNAVCKRKKRVTKKNPHLCINRYLHYYIACVKRISCGL